MTTPDRHQRIYELFVMARDQGADQRKAFLDQACAGDAGLLAEINALLAQEANVSRFLETPPTLGESSGVDPQFETRSSGPHAKDDAGRSERAYAWKSGSAAPNVSIEGYELIRELHRGGQGVVYQAVQQSTKRKVAIKVLHEGPFASKAARSRFEREIELVAQLKHSNIVAIFDSGVTRDGWHYCAMDYIRGLPLHQHVRENHLTLEQALKVFCDVCEAVQYAHHKGVIHRDLKPSNIMVDSEGNPKILDFGLAKQLIGPIETIVSMTHDVVGTLPYMSPEQAKGNPDHIDMRTDIYALGVVLYEILTGHYPYPVVGHMADVLRNITETPPTPPSRQWTPDSGVTRRSGKNIRAGHCPIDGDLQTVILKTLSKERERRYQSAGELARDIGHYLAGEPVEARRDSSWYILRKALVRHKAKFAVAAGFVVLLLAFAIFARWTTREKRVDALIAQGMEAWRRERYEEAGEHFVKALEVDPLNPNALKKACWWKKESYGKKPFAEQDKARLREAAELCATALESDPKNGLLLNLKGSILMALGDHLQAESVFREALVQDQKLHVAGRNLAVVLALQGRMDDAIAEARKAASAESAQDEGETDIYDDEVWRVLGTLQLARGVPEAFDSLETAFKGDRKDTRNTLLRARLHLTLQDHIDYQMALSQAEMADIFTGLVDPRFKRVLALAYLRNGGYKDAAANARKAVEGGDEPAYCHLIAAIAEGKLRNTAGADEHLKKAEDAWPEEFKEHDYIMTAEKDFLWFDTRKELQDLKEEAQQLLASSGSPSL